MVAAQTLDTPEFIKIYLRPQILSESWLKIPPLLNELLLNQILIY